MNAAEAPRILFAPETFNLGETSRAVEVAQAVQAAGGEVLFMGYSRRFADYVQRAGLPLELLDPELSEPEADQLIAADQGRSLRHPFTTDMVRRRVASERGLIEAWRPHCVVIGTTLTLFISAPACGIPLVYVRPYAMSRGHLLHMATLPLVSGTGRVATATNRVAGRLGSRFVRAVRWKPASFRRVATEHGVRLPSRTIEAIDADLNLIASLFPLLDQRPLAEGEVAVGPIYAQSPGDLPDRLRQRADTSRPVVYLGLGSSGGRRLALTILSQLADMDLEVVSSVGRYLTDHDRAGLPDNVQVYDFLPAHLLAGVIDASVVHGGEGTVQTACASGAPFAGIGQQAEQRLNVDECVRYGNAIRFTERDLRRRKLPQMVDRLLHDASLRAAAHRLRALAEPVGAARSAELILNLAGTSGRGGQ